MPRLALAVDDPPRQPLAALVIVRGHGAGQRSKLDGTPFTIGRGNECALVLHGIGIARHHCTVQRDGDAWTLQCTPEVAVLVRGDLVGAAVLVHRTRIQIGRYVLCFLDDVRGTLDSEYHQLLYDLATRDGLTDTFNRRFMEENVKRVLATGRSPVSLVRVRVEDVPPEADERLVAIANALKSVVDEKDSLGRIAEAEFAVLLDHVDDARSVAERLQAAVLRATGESVAVGFAAVAGQSAPAVWDAAAP